MNNYNRYYDRENTQNQNDGWPTNFNHFQQQYESYISPVFSANYGIWSQPEESENKVEPVDKKDARVVTRESLYVDPKQYKSQESEGRQTYSNNHSSSYCWTEQYNWRRAGESSQAVGQGSSRPVRGNKLQKSLNKALAQPVQMSKAESMMLKMGWQGGALGKTGDGIVEPVAPNAAYATKSRGFGQEIKKALKKSERPVHNFKAGYEEYFTPNVLLNILDFVKNDAEIELIFDSQLSKHERKIIHNLVNGLINGDESTMNFDTLIEMDVVQEIHARNNYILCTQSEGKKRDRCLYLYKDPPEHVYLISPDDLKEEVPEDAALDDKTSADEVASISVENKSKAKSNKKENSKIEKEAVSKIEKETVQEPKQMEIDEEETNPFLISITRNLKNNVEETSKDDIVNNEKNVEETKADELEKDLNKAEEVVEDVVKEEFDITAKIVEYFVEFAEGDVYKELRFLGPFDSEERDRINAFLNNVHSCILNIEEYIDSKYEDVLKTVNKGDYSFEIKEDCNGSDVIHKFKKEDRKPS